jgi:hypothetical protein
LSDAPITAMDKELSATGGAPLSPERRLFLLRHIPSIDLCHLTDHFSRLKGIAQPSNRLLESRKGLVTFCESVVPLSERSRLPNLSARFARKITQWNTHSQPFRLTTKSSYLSIVGI